MCVFRRNRCPGIAQGKKVFEFFMSSPFPAIEALSNKIITLYWICRLWLIFLQNARWGTHSIKDIKSCVLNDFICSEEVKLGWRDPDWPALSNMAFKLVWAVHFSNIFFLFPFKFLSLFSSALFVNSAGCDFSCALLFFSHCNFDHPVVRSTSASLGWDPSIINVLFLTVLLQAFDVLVKVGTSNFSCLSCLPMQGLPVGSVTFNGLEGSDTGSFSRVNKTQFGLKIVSWRVAMFVRDDAALACKIWSSNLSNDSCFLLCFLKHRFSTSSFSCLTHIFLIDSGANVSLGALSSFRTSRSVTSFGKISSSSSSSSLSWLINGPISPSASHPKSVSSADAS